jgi:dihydroorotase
LIDGLADGTIDAIATDHAPHAVEEKDIEFEFAAPGIVGLETALALTLTELIEPGYLSLAQALERLSCAPARILGLGAHGGPLERGRPANLTVFDPASAWRVEPARFVSKSRNSPFAGREVRGRVLQTFFNGRPTWRHDAPLAEALA